VGLGYVHARASATTLSGGEAQRVKLARELARKATGRTLYVLDEPTTGLHFDDIEMLLQALFALRDAGNTVVVIEHNLDVIASCDWVVDHRPRRRRRRRAGRWPRARPEDVAAHPTSHTGRYLAEVLGRSVARGAHGHKATATDDVRPEPAKKAKPAPKKTKKR
jgi:excinuclease ABC subunit A